MTARGLALAALATALCACADRTLPPRGQLLLFVDTDAPLAPPAGQVGGVMDPAPLFDQLRVEVLDPRGELACGGCRQDFALTSDLVEAERSTVGLLVPPNRSDLRVRARLYRAVRLRGDDPPTDGAIDGVFALPAIGAEGVVRATAQLPLETVGRPADLAAPASPVTAGFGPKLGLHPAAVPEVCAVPPGDDEVCVPGGAYWMSNAAAPVALLGDALPERVVAISPFIVDRTEVTVRQLRASSLATARDPNRTPAAPTICTYTESPGPNEDLPVTCATWTLARTYCEKKGSTLLTEAQFEFLASGRKSFPYLWGNDAPTCSDVVFGRDYAGDPISVPGLTDVCAGLGTGPARAGSGARDVLRLPGGDVLDVAGNVREWTLDRYQALSDECWGTGFFTDPRCERGTAGRVVRGGPWSQTSVPTHATFRFEAANGDALTGFRCARPGR